MLLFSRKQEKFVRSFPNAMYPTGQRSPFELLTTESTFGKYHGKEKKNVCKGRHGHLLLQKGENSSRSFHENLASVRGFMPVSTERRYEALIPKNTVYVECGNLKRIYLPLGKGTKSPPDSEKVSRQARVNSENFELLRLLLNLPAGCVIIVNWRQSD
ncbi:hypothetical protein NPIL_685631 [Nephila pilipes]|uniref:Uncharacterized protein n=1 Tax=Nephila pilipes TaxID=299642 RepID=A0A8X6TZL7_NEPPI|nr:hypothetical protein NPIL_685631 [Nephila pilipes]